MALSTKDKTRLYHDLGTMLKSGFHLDRGLDLVLGQNPPAAQRAWLKVLRDGVAKGQGLAETLRQTPAGTSELELSLLAAGERGGRLDEACIHLAEYFELRQQSVNKAVGALVYPLILAHFAILVPDFSKVVSGGLRAGFAGLPFRLLTLWALIGLTLAGARAWFRAATHSAEADRLLGLVPLVGAVRRHWALARLSQVMRTGLLAALKTSESLRLAGGASQSAVLVRASERAADAIEAGGNFSGSLRAAGGFPAGFVNSMEVAEQSGALDLELGRWAKAEAELAARDQDRAAEWIPRIFYVLVVLYIATRIIGMFTGYFQALSGAAGDLDGVLRGR